MSHLLALFSEINSTRKFGVFSVKNRNAFMESFALDSDVLDHKV